MLNRNLKGMKVIWPRGKLRKVIEWAQKYSTECCKLVVSYISTQVFPLSGGL